MTEYIQRVEEAAEAFIEAKRILLNQFKQEILKSRDKIEKAKQAKVLRQLATPTGRF